MQLELYPPWHCGQRPRHPGCEVKKWRLTKVDPESTGPAARTHRLQCAGVDATRLQVHMATTLHLLGPVGWIWSAQTQGSQLVGPSPLLRRPRGLGGGLGPWPACAHVPAPEPSPLPQAQAPTDTLTEAHSAPGRRPCSSTWQLKPRAQVAPSPAISPTAQLYSPLCPCPQLLGGTLEHAYFKEASFPVASGCVRQPRH